MARKEQYPSDVSRETIEWYRQPGWQFVDAIDPLAEYSDMAPFANDEHYARITYYNRNRHLVLVYEKPASEHPSPMAFLSILTYCMGRRQK